MMKPQLSVFALTAILIVSVGMTPAFGQAQALITVTTDKESYADGEVITLSGTVRDFYATTPISVIITAPNGNVVALAQITVNQDKTFTKEITAGGQISVEGEYTIKAQYGDPNRTATATFEFGGAMASTGTGTGTGTGSGNGDGTTTIIIDEDGNEIIVSIVPSQGNTPVTGSEEFELGFELTTGSILSVTPNPDDNSLVIAIATAEDGKLTITIPRTVADAKDNNGDDDQFFVLVDGEERIFEETITDTARTLVIEFEAGAEEITIIGTQVIPEFGAIAAMILAVAIVAMIVVSARSRLSIIPRY